MNQSTEKYDDWIVERVAAGKPVIGHCHEACKEMLQAFPELEMRGGYVWTGFGYDLHFWLIAPCGSIVDPTASQFVDLQTEDYEDEGTTDVMQLLLRVFEAAEQLRERVRKHHGE